MYALGLTNIINAFPIIKHLHVPCIDLFTVHSLGLLAHHGLFGHITSDSVTSLCTQQCITSPLSSWPPYAHVRRTHDNTGGAHLSKKSSYSTGCCYGLRNYRSSEMRSSMFCFLPMLYITFHTVLKHFCFHLTVSAVSTALPCKINVWYINLTPPQQTLSNINSPHKSISTSNKNIVHIPESWKGWIDWMQTMQSGQRLLTFHHYGVNTTH